MRERERDHIKETTTHKPKGLHIKTHYLHAHLFLQGNQLMGDSVEGSFLGSNRTGIIKSTLSLWIQASELHTQY